MEILFQKLREVNYANLDVDELLDNRDCKVFDSEWGRVYKEVEKLKKDSGYTSEQKKHNGVIREKAFKVVYELSGNGELAEYISDDFGLIADSQSLAYSDEWFDKLIDCYKNAEIPCGDLTDK